MISEKFVVLIEPGKSPKVVKGDSIEIINETIGSMRDMVYIDQEKDLVMVIDDFACPQKNL